MSRPTFSSPNLHNITLIILLALWIVLAATVISLSGCTLTASRAGEAAGAGASQGARADFIEWANTPDGAARLAAFFRLTGEQAGNGAADAVLAKIPAAIDSAVDRLGAKLEAKAEAIGEKLGAKLESIVADSQARKDAGTATLWDDLKVWAGSIILGLFGVGISAKTAKSTAATTAVVAVKGHVAEAIAEYDATPDDPPKPPSPNAQERSHA